MEGAVPGVGAEGDVQTETKRAGQVVILKEVHELMRVMHFDKQLYSGWYQDRQVKL